ncbi:MAG TPA: gliding motility-associated C-terminal domain-containing protein [Bacteroidales bacterium]|nr:gliding motility-associated C-terminal domain-containing protein [Bacteroidales bacterium]
MPDTVSTYQEGYPPSRRRSDALKRLRVWITLVLLFLLQGHGAAQAFFLNGSTTLSGNGCFQLTPAAAGQSASLWQLSKLDLNQAFDIQYQAQFGNNNSGGNGMVFVLQAEGITALGNPGAGMGYQDITPSLGIEFDTYQDLVGDPFYDHIAISKSGGILHTGSTQIQVPVQASAFSANIEDGLSHHIRITWQPNGDTLRIYFDHVLRVTKVYDIINSAMGGTSQVWWGLTAATSAAFNAHAVCLLQTPPALANTSIDMCQGDTLSLILPFGSGFSWTPATGLSNPSANNWLLFPSGTTNYTVSYTDTSGLPASTAITVNVHPLPTPFAVIIPGGDSTYCKGGSGVDVAMAGSQTTALYDLFLNGSLLWPDVSGNGSGFSFGLMMASGKYTVVATDSTSGCSAPMLGSVTVVIDSLPLVYNVGGGGAYCQFSTGPAITLSGSEAGLSYTLYRNGNINPLQVATGTGGALSFGPQQTAGTYTVHALNPLTGCTRIMAGSAVVTILPLPAVTLASPADLCAGDPAVTLSSGSPAGGTYSGFGIAGGVISNTYNTGPRMLYYTVTHPVNGCLRTDSAGYQVHALPVPDLGPDTSFCAGASVILATSGAYVAYLWDNGTTAPNRTIITGGMYHLRVQDIHGCYGRDTLLASVDPLPVLSLQPFPDACAGDPPLTLNQGSPTGGTWFGMGVSGNVFQPAQTGPGSYNLTYVYTDPLTACLNTISGSMTVYALPMPGLSLPSGVCLSAPPFALSGGFPAGGTWSGPGISGGTFDPSLGSGPRQVTYTYTHPVTGCSASITDTLWVHPLPTVAVPALAPVCLGSAAAVLPPGTPAGGTWQGPGVSGGSFMPPPSPGTYSLGYYYQDPLTGCADSAFTFKVVHPLPVVTFQSSLQACEGDAPFPLNGGLPTGGTYSGPLYSGGMFVPLFAGSYTLTYSWIDPSTQCQSSSSYLLPVYPLPTATLLAPAPFCLTDPPVALSGGSPLGGSYILDGNPADSLFPILAGAGTHALAYAYTDSASTCTDTAQVPLQVHPLPQIQHPPPGDLCMNGLPFLLSGGTPAGGTYSGPGLNGNLFHPSAPGTYTLFYHYQEALTGCRDSLALSITVHPLPNVGLSLPAEVCANATPLTLSGGTPGGGTYSGAGISAGTFSPAFGNGPRVVHYTYEDPVTGCRDTVSDTIMVHPLPVMGLSLPGPFCASDPDTLLLGGNPAGGTYSGTGISGGLFQPSVGSGVYTIQYFYEDPLTSCRDTVAGSILVHPLPQLQLTPWPDICAQGNPLPLTYASPTGGTWSGTGVSGGSFNPQISGPGTFGLSYAYTSPFTGCSDSLSDSIRVYPQPLVSFVVDTSLCLGAAALSLSGGSPAGGTYGGSGVSAGTFSPAVAAAHAIWYVWADPATQCSDTARDTLTVYPLPQVMLSPAPDYCAGDPPVALGPATPAGGWWSGAAGPGGLFDPGQGSGTYIYTYHYADPLSQCADSARDTLLVHALPAVSAPTLPDLCINDSLFTLPAGSPSGGLWGGPGVTAGVFDPAMGAGTWSLWYAYSDPASGCSDTAAAQLIVHDLPTLTFSAPGPLCQSDPVILVGGGQPAGGTYFSPYMSGSNFFPSLTGPGYWPVWYAYTDPATGCMDTVVDSIRVHPLPTVIAPGGSSLCMDALPYPLPAGSPTGGYWTGPGIYGDSLDPGGPGTFVLWYTYTDPQTGCRDSASAAFTIHPLPDPQLPPDTAFCQGGSVTLAAPGPYQSWQWSDGSTAPYLVVQVTGTFWLVVTDPNQCISVPDTVSVEVWPSPVPGIPSDTSVCYGGLLSYDAPQGFTSYAWSNGQHGPLLISGQGGSYILTVTDQAGCEGWDTLLLMVLPVPELLLPDSLFLCADDVHILDAGPGATGVDFLWSDGLQGEWRVVSEPGWYAVTADNGACSSRDSCLVLPCARIWVPNAFTPNGDGVNDRFFPVSSEPLLMSRLTILDRWGNVVFSSAGGQEGWDGTRHGRPCPTDVYTWVLDFWRKGPVPLEQEGRLHGMVVLVR